MFTGPFLVRRFCHEVTIQQVRCDVELVVAVSCNLVFACPHNGYIILAHQTANAAMPNVQTSIFQFFGHAWPAVAAKAETRFFFDVCQSHHVRPLPETGRTVAEGTQPACAYADNVAQPVSGEMASALFDKPKLHCFRPAKNWVAFFRISLSSLRSRTSRRSRSFSLARFKSSFDTTSISRCAVTHLFSVDTPTPRSSATCLRVSP